MDNKTERQQSLNPRELNQLTEYNTKPYILQAGTQVEICLRRNGHSAIEFGAGEKDLPKIVGTFNLGSEIPIVVDSFSEGDVWEMYLKPTSEALFRARKVLDKLEGAEEMTEKNRGLCRDGRKYIAQGALHEIEAKILKDNPDLASSMAKAGLTTAGFDIVFHLKS